MVQTPKINCLDNDGESFKNALSKEPAEKSKNHVRTHAVSEFSDRFDALEKASELNVLIQESRFGSLSKKPAHNMVLDAAKKASELTALKKLASTRESQNTLAKARDVVEKALLELDALSKASVHSIALDTAKKASELATLKKLAATRESQNTLAVASKVLLSFNLYPMKSFETNLKNINYPQSIAQALARDWQNVGNDLWKGYLTVSSNQPSDNDE